MPLAALTQFVPVADLILFTATADMSIVSLNLSLMLNNVGFYQVLPLPPHNGSCLPSSLSPFLAWRDCWRLWCRAQITVALP